MHRIKQLVTKDEPVSTREPIESPVSYGVACECNRRYRKTMEDFHTINWDTLYRNNHRLGYFAVFDGHAGSQTARFCADTLHHALAPHLQKESVPEALNAAFLDTDEKLSSQAKLTHNSGSTAAVAVLDMVENKLYVANVGDTRVVLCRGGEPLRLSYDHKGSDENEQQRVLNAGGLLVNNRVNGMLAITRALGDAYMKDYVVGSPYTTETELYTSDEFFIIACDGLWDVCSDKQAVDLVRGEKDATVAAKALVAYALEALSTDNLTVMVIRLAEKPKHETPSKTRR